MQRILIQRLPLLFPLSRTSRPLRLRRRRRRRVQRLRRQHHRRRIRQEHRVHRRAIKLVQIQPRHLRVAIRVHLVLRERLRLVVARVRRGVGVAGRGLQLAPVDGDGGQGEAVVAVEDEGAVLPLHYCLRAGGLGCWVWRSGLVSRSMGGGGGLTVGDSAIVCFFVESICSEGIGDARMGWLD